jgi:hypothetical protein
VLEAARVLPSAPQALQLRYLATLFDIAGEKTQAVVFPLPLQTMNAGLVPPEQGQAL